MKKYEVVVEWSSRILLELCLRLVFREFIAFHKFFCVGRSSTEVSSWSSLSSQYNMQNMKYRQDLRIYTYMHEIMFEE